VCRLGYINPRQFTYGEGQGVDWSGTVGVDDPRRKADDRGYEKEDLPGERRPGDCSPGLPRFRFPFRLLAQRRHADIDSLGAEVAGDACRTGRHFLLVLVGLLLIRTILTGAAAGAAGRRAETVIGCANMADVPVHLPLAELRRSDPERVIGVAAGALI
jgi:hypothetical protein